MKLLTIVCLTGLVWLTGCASTGVTTGTDPNELYSPEGSNASTPAGAYASKARRPSLGGGALKPITAGQAHSRSVAQLAPPADLWERMRRGFSMPELDTELVHDREQWYSSRPDYILRMTERSRKYIFHIVEELERRNMPTELALLPFVESAFNPQAVSSAKAAGMWQFMPATGKHFELKQNAFRDDRLDVLASTRAALDYLQKLHVMFGDWELALAAYNWGEGSVGRAIAKNKRVGLGLSYSDLSMPMETRFYVPKLLALKNIVANPEAFNSRLPLIENHPYFQTVDIKRDIDVALVAKLAEVSLEDFKALNPSANRPVIFAAGTPQILLPWDNAAVFQSNLEAYGVGRLASWTVWVAPATMKPSDAATRVGMSEEDLRRANNIPPRMMIKVGSSLLVTRSKQLETDVTGHVADNGQLSFSPDIILKRTVLKAGKKDSVASLAKRYQVSPASVADWNNMNASAAFKAGQQIVLFLPARASALVQSRSRSTGKASAPQAKRKVTKSTRVARH
ncbi:MAG: transglycosylase SLT domain-containing protein [Rhodoferax sp.]|uniref:transglycosylase SLT domain-containing protein n=1 Tax=Rhodoferax sp. TaxID=50421 RepID=UPI001810D593|nr:transglycosylase SLT domain-containing protein [Rhodoferax sp.]NMM12999.1 transglycosylase SLT domain-containing protein [Rhodoferax sp.]NMM19278.1 transglycosylase SLT domain-containing protein [Rhodoferax sp.]